MNIDASYAAFLAQASRALFQMLHHPAAGQRPDSPHAVLSAQAASTGGAVYPFSLDMTRLIRQIHPRLEAPVVALPPAARQDPTAGLAALVRGAQHSVLLQWALDELFERLGRDMVRTNGHVLKTGHGEQTPEAGPKSGTLRLIAEILRHAESTRAFSADFRYGIEALVRLSDALDYPDQEENGQRVRIEHQAFVPPPLPDGTRAQIYIAREAPRRRAGAPDAALVVFEIETNALGNLAFALHHAGRACRCRITVADPVAAEVIRPRLDELREGLLAAGYDVASLTVLSRHDPTLADLISAGMDVSA